MLQTECGFEIGLMDGIEGFLQKMNMSIDMGNPLRIKELNAFRQF